MGLAIYSIPSTGASTSIELLSRNSAGIQSNKDSRHSEISSNGNYVVFESDADNLIPYFWGLHVYKKDIKSGVLSAVSTTSTGSRANGSSYNPSVSGDGTFVAFASNASNLVPGDNNNLTDVFVKDTLRGSITMATRTADVAQGNSPDLGSSELINLSISDDGRYVAFDSDSTNLDDNDTNGVVDIFVKDTLTGEISRISKSPDGIQANRESRNPQISGNGRYVVFESNASNIIPDPSPGYKGFRKDILTGEIIRIPNCAVDPSISYDGRYVACGANYTYRIDMFTGQSQIASSSSDGTILSYNTGRPSISGDGRYVSFIDDSCEIMPNLCSPYAGWQLFVKDMNSGAVDMVSRSFYGIPSNNGAGDSSFSRFGSMIAFDSIASDLVIDDSNHTPGNFFGEDIFLALNSVYTEPVNVSKNISGRIHDGRGHYLEGTRVLLFSGDGQYIKMTTSDQQGYYSFSIDQPDDYEVKVILENQDENIATILKLYVTQKDGQSHPAEATRDIKRNQFAGQHDVQINFNFSDLASFDDIGELSPENAERLQAAASIWYWIYESYKIAISPAAGVLFDYRLPIQVYVYGNHCGDGASYVVEDSSICISEERVGSTPWIMKKQGALHEFGHAIMADMYDVDSNEFSKIKNYLSDGSENHWGYANPDTGDSIAEGFAEFWACLTAAKLGLSEPYVYDEFGSIEINSKAWWPAQTENIVRIPQEEFAFAGVLWDLFDGINTSEIEDISLDSKEVLDYVLLGQPENVYQIYRQMKDDGLPLGSLDTIFTTHGFFRDSLEPPWEYQQPEFIGSAANSQQIDNFYVPESDGHKIIPILPRSDRNDRPYSPNLFAEVNTVDKNGLPVAGSTAHVSVTFPNPYNGYNYSYDVSLPESQGFVYVDLPSGEFEPTVQVTVTGPAGDLSPDVLTLASPEYFSLVNSADNGKFVDKIFTVQNPKNHYFTWYDNRYARNWLLMGNHGSEDIKFDMTIGNQKIDISSQLGWVCSNGPCDQGEVPPNMTLAPIFDDTIGGPVKVRSLTGDQALVSSRTLWSGYSLEEVVGAEESKLSSHYYWTWYDQLSAGYTNWVLIANPSETETVRAQISIQGQVRNNTIDTSRADYGTDYFDIPPGENVTPTFPGTIGGPVEVKAFIRGGDWRIEDDRRNVIASQRVLSNYGSAFNEAVGVPAEELSSHYVWTWYDMKSQGARNWVLIANPGSEAVDYEISIEGVDMSSDPNATGTIQPGEMITPTFPGEMGGPVEVRAYLSGGDPVIDLRDVIASQRIVFGPSFGETLGYPADSLSDIYHWTWYDQLSNGMVNWVLVTNNNESPIYYEISIPGVDTGTYPAAKGIIQPGKNATPTFPTHMGGPVQVQAWTDDTKSTPADVFASQRVLYNGYFNEVVGAVLE